MIKSSRLDAARQFLGRGFQPVPIPERQKAPILQNWPDFRVDSDLEQFFSGSGNIGVLLGEASGGLIDIDLDAPEALSLASDFLPATGSVFGRAGKKRSHWLYIVEPTPKTMKFQDPCRRPDAAMLVELRSTGAQTVFPPSTHPSGERVEWHQDGRPAHIGKAELLQAAQHLAAAALLIRYYPAEGSRHELALALSGALIRAAWSPEEVASLLKAVAVAAGDAETRDRARAGHYSARRINTGQPATGWPRLEKIVGREIVLRLREWLVPNGQERHREVDGTTSGRDSQATKLVNLVSQAEFFHAPDQTCYVTVPISTHFETLPIRSKSFRHYLAGLFYKADGKAPGSQAIHDALNVIEARALFDAPQNDIFVRVAEHAGSIWLDLGDAEWNVVEISPAGWRVIQNPPVKFRHPRGMLALPAPLPGGTINELYAFLNLATDADRALVVCWIVGALRPRGPYPLLCLHGEQGTAKSTTARVIRDFIDPNVTPLRSLPREERDMQISARHSHMVVYDNVSRLEDWTSDALCRLATGGGLATRQLYTDEEEILFDAQRPVLLNGIEELAVQGDFLDRAIPICLPQIVEDARRDERQFWSDFERVRPRISGALLDGVSAALRDIAKVNLERKPRMADFALWAVAAEPALGIRAGTFLSAYQQNRREANQLALEGSLVAEHVLKFIAEEDHWEGAVTELLEKLNTAISENTRKERRWPKTARGLSGALRRIASNLRAVGVGATFIGREPGRGRALVRLERVGGESSQSSLPSQTPQPTQGLHIARVQDERACAGCEDREDYTVLSSNVADSTGGQPPRNWYCPEPLPGNGWRCECGVESNSPIDWSRHTGVGGCPLKATPLRKSSRGSFGKADNATERGDSV